MLVRSSIRGNADAANSRCLSQVKKRYVTSARESSASALGHRVNEFQGLRCVRRCGASRDLESSRFFEEGAATIDMHGKGVQILLHRHSCTIAEFLWISPQQFDAVIVEPLGTFDDAAQIFRMGQSIEALEVLSSEAGDNRSPIVIA